MAEQADPSLPPLLEEEDDDAWGRESTWGLIDGEADEAIAQYRQALEIAPDDVDACNNLGLALARRGQGDEAVVHFRKAQPHDTARPSAAV